MSLASTKLGIAAAAAGMWLVVACAGAKNTELFAVPEATDASAAGAAPDAADGLDSAPPATTPWVDAALADAPIEASSGVGDSETPTTKIVCGARSCSLPPDVCCLASDSETLACTHLGACAGTEVACTERADCPPSQTCCGTYVRASRRYDRVACRASCSRNDETGFDVTFCALQNGNGDCPSGQRCFASQVYAGFHVCG